MARIKISYGRNIFGVGLFFLPEWIIHDLNGWLIAPLSSRIIKINDAHKKHFWY